MEVFIGGCTLAIAISLYLERFLTPKFYIPCRSRHNFYPDPRAFRNLGSIVRAATVLMTLERSMVLNGGG